MMRRKHKTYAEIFHEETKYTPEGLSHCDVQLDLSKQPSAFKDYRGHFTVDLSPYIPLGTNPFSQAPVKSISEWSPAEQPLGNLSRLLYFVDGITAMVPYPPNPLLMRSAPSAGGLYPLEIYVFLAEDISEELRAGLYHYQPKTHSLAAIEIGDAPTIKLRESCFNHEVLRRSHMAIVITGMFQRGMWRYQDRAYRRILLDAGHILGNIGLIGESFRIHATGIYSFWDDHLNDLLRTDHSEEQALAVIALRRCTSDERCRERTLRQLPSLGQYNGQEIPLGKRLLYLHEASKIYEHDAQPPTPPFKNYVQTTQPAMCQIELSSVNMNFGQCSLLSTILKRRSARRLNKQISIHSEQLHKILNFSHPSRQDSYGKILAYLITSSEFIKTYVIVHAVVDMDSGVYQLDPHARILRQIRYKSLSEECRHVCLGQDLGGDASMLIVHACDLELATSVFGDRAYRYLHLDAGHYGQRISVAATALGLGASGIGGFFDDMVNELLGISASDSILYITAVGIPYE